MDTVSIMIAAISMTLVKTGIFVVLSTTFFWAISPQKIKDKYEWLLYGLHKGGLGLFVFGGLVYTILVAVYLIRAYFKI